MDDFAAVHIYEIVSLKRDKHVHCLEHALCNLSQGKPSLTSLAIVYMFKVFSAY